ncbi:MAG TPA: pirin family protein [Cyclobacteriaceae bacterium]|jgi:redox-sensitive bicupin YhaK (pirin superfamily)|nr:pirin family protein [Cyclobacteriaceae bacterium]
MKTILHKAETRGHANHGWLDSHHTFSFASYYDPTRLQFGALRVLNDDIVAGGRGFGTHPHDNMEIVSIPLKGELEHKDTTGRNEIIKTNDVQIMSAGSGIAHSEYNASKTDPVNFLQIWVFPKVRNIKPLYNQKSFSPADRKDKFQAVVAPEENSNAVFINQDAWFSLGNLTAGTTLDYTVKKNGNGVYVFVLEGDVSIGNQQLNKRDGFGIWETDKISFKADSNAEVLLIDVPMS